MDVKKWLMQTKLSWCPGEHMQVQGTVWDCVYSPLNSDDEGILILINFPDKS